MFEILGQKSFIEALLIVIYNMFHGETVNKQLNTFFVEKRKNKPLIKSYEAMMKTDFGLYKNKKAQQLTGEPTGL